MSDNIMSHLKNLIFNVHQNYLILMNLVLERMPRELETNVWAIKLRTNINSKQVKTLESQDAFLLGQTNLLISNILTKFNHIYYNNRNDIYIFDILNDILRNSDRYTYLTVKSIAFNIVIFYYKYLIFNIFVEKFYFSYVNDESKCAKSPNNTFSLFTPFIT